MRVGIEGLGTDRGHEVALPFTRAFVRNHAVYLPPRVNRLEVCSLHVVEALLPLRTPDVYADNIGCALERHELVPCPPPQAMSSPHLTMTSGDIEAERTM